MTHWGIVEKENACYFGKYCENKNPDKAKQQLLRENVLLEGFGGDIPSIEVSAKSGTNIKELLDLILLLSDMRTDKTKSDLFPWKLCNQIFSCKWKC